MWFWLWPLDWLRTTRGGQCGINNSSICSNCYGPRAFGGPAVLCVKFGLYYMQGYLLEFRCPRQTLRKGPYILHTLYRSFIRWKQVQIFILFGNLLLRESTFCVVNCLKSIDFKLFFVYTRGGQQVDRDRPVHRQASVGRSRLILPWIDTIPENITLQSIYQKAQNYPSDGWSRVFFGASCDGWPLLAQQMPRWCCNVFLLLRANHDLGVTDTLPSICASLAKAMYCMCTVVPNLSRFAAPNRRGL